MYMCVQMVVVCGRRMRMCVCVCVNVWTEQCVMCCVD